MPCYERKGGWYMGGRKYRSKAACERAYRAYLAKKKSKRSRKG